MIILSEWWAYVFFYLLKFLFELSILKRSFYLIPCLSSHSHSLTFIHDMHGHACHEWMWENGDWLLDDVREN